RATGMSRLAGAGAVPVGVRHRGLRVPVITWGRGRQGGPCRLVLATGSLVLESAGQAGGCRGGTLA
ncbi:hypothetical protein N5I20_22650, partial [Aeromonas caviae]